MYSQLGDDSPSSLRGGKFTGSPWVTCAAAPPEWRRDTCSRRRVCAKTVIDATVCMWRAEPWGLNALEWDLGIPTGEQEEVGTVYEE